MLGQVPPKLLRHAFLRVDVAVDCFLADPERRTFLDQPVADLLRGPAVLDPLDDLISKLRMPDQLALPNTPVGGFLMRGGAVVAVVTRQALIAEPVPLDLAINGGFRALKHACIDPAESAQVKPLM